MMDT
jgi:KRAB domain-containing zinc finger protein